MTPAIYHFAGRVREAVRSPRLLLAGLACGVFAATLDARVATHVRHPLVVMMFGLSYLGGLASVIGPGASSSPGQGRFWSTRFVGVDKLDWAHPPLPLGSRSRVLAEALAAVVIILAWRAILEPAYVLALPPGSWAGILGFARDRWVEACMILPCAVAWLSPARSRALHVVRSVAIAPLVIAWSLLAPRVGIWSWPVVALVLTVGLLELSQVRLRFTVPFRGRTRAGALVRRARTPESQLWRDFWSGPLTANVLVALFMLVALVSNAILYSLSRDRSFVSGMATGAWVALLLVPLGVQLLGRQARRGGTPLFGGSFVAAWSALPVRRDTLLRGVYAHGLLWGGCLSVFSLTFPDLDGRWLIGPAGLAASLSVAGALVSVAIGDRWRGLLSMGATVVSLGALAMPAMLTHAAPVWTTVAPIAVAALAGAAGGLPPLVHLGLRRAERR